MNNTGVYFGLQESVAQRLSLFQLINLWKFQPLPVARQGANPNSGTIWDDEPSKKQRLYRSTIPDR